MIHSDRVVRETTLGRGREDRKCTVWQRKQNTVTELSWKVQSNRAVKESTQRQSSQGRYTETEKSGKVQSDRAVRESTQRQSS